MPTQAIHRDADTARSRDVKLLKRTAKSKPTLPEITIDNLEAALLKQKLPEGSSLTEPGAFSNELQTPLTVRQIVLKLLPCVLNFESKEYVNEDNYNQYLAEFLREYSSHLAVHYGEQTDFASLEIHVQVEILKTLVDAVLDANDDALRPWKSQVPAAEMICETIEDWHKWMAKFSTSSRKPAERELAMQLQQIGSIAVRSLQAQQAAKVRREAKLKRMKEIEVTPRKRSKRLEKKYDKELEVRKMEEIQRQQQELEAIQRRHEKEKKEKLKEQEQEQIALAERNLKTQVYQIVDDLRTEYMRKHCVQNGRRSRVIENEKLAFFTYLSEKLSRSAGEKDRINKMRGWASLLSPANSVQVAHGSRQAKSLIQKLVFQGNGCSKATIRSVKAAKSFCELEHMTREDVKHYYQVVPEPMDIQTIYKKLMLNGYCHLKHRQGFEQFLYDLELIFTNCYMYYSEDSKEYQDAQTLESYVYNLSISVFGNGSS
ncbi:histone acetyltransferase [Apophysomyces ossiformis]|uniref:Histone acetyltransferase n=1 Tax=Apophysomyces ossiformis TaxID=679940 RepID=A0A8H7BKU6_9FUNG|nr:histone acetyltransferase [Apophysomyces ossiformis]